MSALLASVHGIQLVTQDNAETRFKVFPITVLGKALLSRGNIDRVIIINGRFEGGGHNWPFSQS